VSCARCLSESASIKRLSFATCSPSARSIKAFPFSVKPTSVPRRDAIEPFEYSAMYGYTWDRVIASNASKIVAQTAARYLDVLGASEATA